MLRSELKIWPNARWTGCSTAATAASNFGPLAAFRTKRLVKRGDSPRCLRCSFCVYGESHLFVARPAERQASVYLLLLGLIGNKVFHSRFCRQSAAAGDHDETTTSWGLACNELPNTLSVASISPQYRLPAALRLCSSDGPDQKSCSRTVCREGKSKFVRCCGGRCRWFPNCVSLHTQREDTKPSESVGWWIHDRAVFERSKIVFLQCGAVKVLHTHRLHISQ